MKGHSQEVWALAFSPVVKGLLASGGGAEHGVSGRPGEIFLWDFFSGTSMGALSGHSQGIQNLDFHPKEPILASASQDGTLGIWDVKGDKLLRRLKASGPQAALAFSPDGSQLASGGFKGDEAIRLWDWSSGKNTLVLDDPWPGYVLELAFAPDGKSLFAGGYLVQHWDLQKQRRLHNVALQQNHVLAVAVHPKTGHGVYGLHDGGLVWLDLQSKKVLTRGNAHSSRVSKIRFSADGALMFSASWDGGVYIWDVRSPGRPQVLQKLSAHPGQKIYSLAIHPDGKVFATGASDKTVRIWKCAPKP